MNISGSTIYFAHSWTNWPASVELFVFGILAVGLYLFGAHLIKLHAYELAKALVLSKFKTGK